MLYQSHGNHVEAIKVGIVFFSKYTKEVETYSLIESRAIVLPDVGENRRWPLWGPLLPRRVWAHSVHSHHAGYRCGVDVCGVGSSKESRGALLHSSNTANRGRSCSKRKKSQRSKLPNKPSQLIQCNISPQQKRNHTRFKLCLLTSAINVLKLFNIFLKRWEFKSSPNINRRITIKTHLGQKKSSSFWKTTHRPLCFILSSW